tara:strand:- start:198 stop:359 length:162 start_codon:yes stop_codon:yes gene_type:complete
MKVENVMAIAISIVIVQLAYYVVRVRKAQNIVLVVSVDVVMTVITDLIDVIVT